MFSIAILFIYFSKKYFRIKQNEILFRNVHIIIVNKTYDLKINSNKKSENTVQTFLRSLFPELVSKKLYHEFYFPHRLDYATSGIICIPITKNCCKEVAKAFEKRLTKKYYVALVRGWISQEILTVNSFIGEDQNHKHIQKMTVSTGTSDDARPAKTVIMVLEMGFYDGYPSTKVLIRPITGRRHQIRVHCNHLGHTIVGDFTYSNKKDIKPSRMFLHSIRLMIPTSFQEYDFQTKDPFNNECRNWMGFKVLNELNTDAYCKLDYHC